MKKICITINENLKSSIKIIIAILIGVYICYSLVSFRIIKLEKSINHLDQIGIEDSLIDIEKNIEIIMNKLEI